MLVADPVDRVVGHLKNSVKACHGIANLKALWFGIAGASSGASRCFRTGGCLIRDLTSPMHPKSAGAQKPEFPYPLPVVVNSICFTACEPEMEFRAIWN